jgi:hypothetical protein
VGARGLKEDNESASWIRPEVDLGAKRYQDVCFVGDCPLVDSVYCL